VAANRLLTGRPRGFVAGVFFPHPFLAARLSGASTFCHENITAKTAVFWAIALMMEAARTSETLVKLYQTTRCYNPGDSHLHTHRRENLKSYILRIVYNNKYSLTRLKYK
jgi:hypothetical protein